MAIKKKISQMDPTPGLRDTTRFETSRYLGAGNWATEYCTPKDIAESYGLAYAGVTADSSQILTLNSVPIDIVPAAAGDFILPVVAFFECTAGTPYATHTGLMIVHESCDAPIFYSDYALLSSVDRGGMFVPFPISDATALQLKAGKRMRLTVSGGNPTAGDFDIAVHVLYRKIPTML